jgi:hypothetical protein
MKPIFRHPAEADTRPRAAGATDPSEVAKYAVQRCSLLFKTNKTGTKQVTINRNINYYDLDSSPLSAQDLPHARRLGEITVTELNLEADPYAPQIGIFPNELQEADVLWLAESGRAAILPEKCLAWFQDGALSGEMYRFIYGVGRE